MSNPHIGGSLVIFGEALIDAFPDNDRIGGAPFNVARTVSAFDRAALLITRIGADPRGQLVRAEMQRFGLNEAGCQTDHQHSTGLVRVEADAGTHRFVIAQDQAYDYIDSELAQSAFDTYLEQHSDSKLPAVLYFGTLAQRQPDSRQCLERLLKATPLVKYLDLNLRDGQTSQEIILASLHHADILKINDDELQVLVAAFNLPAATVCTSLADDAACATIFEALGQLLSLFGLDAIIVTLGAHGYIYSSADGQQINGYQSSPAAIEVVDTVGCGDAFSAIFLVGLLNGWPVGISLQRAHCFAGQVCTIQGAVSSDAQFYSVWKKQWFAPLPLINQHN